MRQKTEGADELVRVNGPVIVQIKSFEEDLDLMVGAFEKLLETFSVDAVVITA